jgi:hypothetical protein
MSSLRRGFTFSFAIAILNTAALASEKPLDWSGVLGSAASRFRADTGVTLPLLYALPEWSRNNALDLDVLARNSAALAVVSDAKRRFVPLSLQGFVEGGAYDVIHAVETPGPEGTQILSALDADGKRLQRMVAAAHTYYIMKNFAYSAHFVQQRNIWLEGSPEIFRYQYFRDLWLQFSSGGRVFDDSSVGSLDFGSNVKGIVRLGADKAVLRSNITASTKYDNSEFGERAFALGLDYSLLWSSPNFEETPYALQIALVGKDIGTTKFTTAKSFFGLIGIAAPSTREFPRIPNDTILGLGLKLPNFRDGFRSALRVEWNYWTRPIPSFKKLGVSYELRFPFLGTLYSGFRGGNFTGGVGLRFRGVELDFGSFTELWGNGPQLVERRGWIMELRSVF